MVKLVIESYITPDAAKLLEAEQVKVDLARRRSVSGVKPQFNGRIR